MAYLFIKKNMKNLYHLIFFSDSQGLKINMLYVIFFLPIIIMTIQALLFIIPSTRHIAFGILKENGPIEILTFLVFLVGGVFGLIFMIKNFNKVNKFVTFFIFIFSVGLLFISLEEISWGQWFFYFETSDYWKTLNFQRETNLHNLHGLQNHSDTFCLIYGIAGIIGVLLRNFTFFKLIGTPIILLSWFLIITCHAIIDIAADYNFTGAGLEWIIERDRELIELLIGLSAFLYLWLNKRKFDKYKLV
jgi:hypothetical protein